MKAITIFRISTLVFIGLFLLAVSHLSVSAKDVVPEDTGFEDWAKQEPKPGWYDWGKKYWPTKPVRGGVFHSAAIRYVGMMNPNHWPINDWGQVGLFYDAPLKTGGDYRIDGLWLASSWKYLDPVTLEMKFRKGVMFHDGTPFNAHAYKYQFDWVMDKKNTSIFRGMLMSIKSTEVKDEYTMIWHFKKPSVSFMGQMIHTVGWALSEKALKGSTALREANKLAKKAETARKKAIKAEGKAKEAAAKGGAAAKKAESKAKKARKAAEKAEKKAKETMALAEGAKNFDTHPVGTGQWMLDEASPGNYLKVKRNPDWWFGRSVGLPDMPYFDGIRINVIPDPSIQLANLRAGKIDMLSIDKTFYPMIKDDPKFNVYINPALNVMGMFFMHAKGPCKDIRVRKAISHAIDRKALIVGTQNGLARIASAVFPEDHWAHNPDLKPVAYDPELSKKLLKDAGYPKGLKIVGVGSPVDSSIVEAIKHMLMEVGIDWQVDILDRAAGTARLQNLSYDLTVFGGGQSADPDMFSHHIYHPKGNFNRGRANNEKALQLFEASRGEMDSKKRQEIYHKFEAALYENYEDVWLWWGLSVVAYRKNVQGWNNDMNKKYGSFYSSSHPLWFKDGKR
jgi:ABC-type transport system substrate-binding protein